MKTCGCVAPPRRRCQLCRGPHQVFVACSRACLEAHERSRHAGAAGERGVLPLMSEANRNHNRNWELYEGHRQRVSALVQALQRGEGLCVLGAGNCDDLDLPALISTFGTLHLTDIDGAALERGVARLPERLRQRIVRHEGVDLAGYLSEVDAWEKGVPPLAELLPRAGATAQAMVSAIGAGPFDVVLSSCVLTQLWVPLKRTLVLGPPEWNRIFALMALTHLLAIAALTRPGGSGVLATEVAEGEPNLELLLTMLREHPDLGPMVESPRLVEPWPWNVNGRLLQTHAVVFRRAAAAERD